MTTYFVWFNNNNLYIEIMHIYLLFHLGIYDFIHEIITILLLL